MIDRDNNDQYLSAVLVRWGSRAKKILIRGTQAFGEKAEGSDMPGLWPAMRGWLEQNPDWFVAMHRPISTG